MLLQILNVPLRIIRLPFKLIVMIRHRKTFHLPLAGMSETQIQTIVSSLRHAAASPQEQRLAEEWLASIQVGQVALSLLLAEQHRISSNLSFWENRMQQGRHFWFALFRQGPVSFLRSLVQLLPFHKLNALVATSSNTSAIEGASSSTSNSNAESTAAISTAPKQELNAAEMAERRVLLFTVLQTALCEALGKVQEAGNVLDLQSTASGNQGMDVADGGEADRTALFQHVERLVDSSMTQIALAFDTLQLRAEQTMQQHADIIDDGHTAGQEQESQRLLRAPRLSLQHVQRLFTSRQRAALEHRASTLTSIPRSNSPTRHIATSVVSPRTAAAGGHQPLVVVGDGDGALAAAQRSVGFGALVAPEDPVHSVIEYARRTSYQMQCSRQLIKLPQWAPMPSSLQQYWVRWCLVGAATSYGMIFLVRHSRLCGSSDLRNWTEAAVKIVDSVWKSHVMEPLGRVQAELFDTFRRRPAIVSIEEWAADRDSLERMLDEFKVDYVKRNGVQAARAPSMKSSRVAGGTGADSRGGDGYVAATSAVNGTGLSVSEDEVVLEGMEIMMRSYEQELKRPIKNVLSGSLLRSLLIQVQKLKVDTESAMLEIDQILRANELNVALIAAIPAFAVAGAGLWGLGRWLTPSPPDPRREAVPARMAMIEVEKALSQLIVEEGGGAEATEEEKGVFLYKLAVAYQEAEILFRKHRGLISSVGDAEWPRLESDLLELASPRPLALKLRTIDRMMRVYSVYQQF